jgi:integral membrane sensor domain MASE1
MRGLMKEADTTAAPADMLAGPVKIEPGQMLSSWRPSLESLWPCLAVGAAVFACAWAGVALIEEVGRVAALWPANALVLAILLRASRVRWTRFLLAGFAGNVLGDLAAGDTIVVALGLSACNAIETLLAAWIAERLAGRRIELTRGRSIFVSMPTGVSRACSSGVRFSDGCPAADRSS